MIGEIITLVILILLSGFFSGIETAFLSMRNTKIRFLKQHNTPGIWFVENLKDNPRRLIITILIGNNIVNIGASALATSVAINLLSGIDFPFSHPVGIATGVMTLLILTFGEIIPKVYAQIHSVKICLKAGRIIWLLQKLLLPLVVIFEGITFLATKLSGDHHKHEKLSEEEIKSIVYFGHKEGAIERIEKDIIQNVLEFDDKKVKDIMTPRKNVVGVQASARAGDVLKVFLSSGFNRLVVFENKNVVGIASIWKLLKCMERHKGHDIPVKKIMGRAFAVSPGLYLDEVFKEFKRRKRHLALVVDKNKRLVGIITDQDLLDEFFGKQYEEPHPSTLVHHQ